MKSYKLEISAMGEHITSKSHLNENFAVYQNAVSKFIDVCERLNIDYDLEQKPVTYTDSNEITLLSAGGRGYDYRVELIELEK